MQLTIFTYVYEASLLVVRNEQKVYAQCIVGKVDGSGCDGQPNYTICDDCRPCHSILMHLSMSVPTIPHTGKGGDLEGISNSF